MRKKMFRVIAAILLIGTFFVSYNLISVAAEESDVIFQGGSQDLISLPDQDDLWLNFKQMMPGETDTQTINVTNSTQDTVNIYLRAEGAERSDFDSDEAYAMSNELIGMLNLTLELTQPGSDVSTVIYDGPASGVPAGEQGEVGDMTTPISLGSFAQDSSATIVATLQVPEELDNRYQNAMAKVRWIFSVEGKDVVSDDSSTPETSKPQTDGPTTGDYLNLIWIGIAVIASACLVVVLLVLRKKADNKNEDGEGSGQ